jgi:HSP20 family molecular chaperone IbpA
MEGIMLSSIPPNTAFKCTRPTKKLNYYNPKPKAKSTIVYSPETISAEDVRLDLFEENNFLRIVGDFHGMEENELILSLSNEKLIIVSRTDSHRKCHAEIDLPENFKIKILTTEMRNGIMTIVLEQVRFEEVSPKLQKVFDSCLLKFPELGNIEIRVVRNQRKKDTIEGAKGKVGNRDVVVIFIPDLSFDNWEIFRPIIFHELSHFVNLENPDEIFYERADEKSIQLWNLLKENKKMNCIV